jgi:hypothetical protein
VQPRKQVKLGGSAPAAKKAQEPEAGPTRPATPKPAAAAAPKPKQGPAKKK